MPDGFDKSEHALRPVSFDVVHGLMFVCFTDAPPSLEGCKKDLAEPFRAQFLQFKGLIHLFLMNEPVLHQEFAKRHMSLYN